MLEVRSARFQFDRSGAYPLVIIEFDEPNSPEAVLDSSCGQWLNYRLPGYVWIGEEFSKFVEPITVHAGTNQEMTFRGLTNDPVVVAIARLFLDVSLERFITGTIYEKGRGFVPPYENWK